MFPNLGICLTNRPCHIAVVSLLSAVVFAGVQVEVQPSPGNQQVIVPHLQQEPTCTCKFETCEI